jgi:hypothetical protein
VEALELAAILVGYQVAILLFVSRLDRGDDKNLLDVAIGLAVFVGYFLILFKMADFLYGQADAAIDMMPMLVRVAWMVFWALLSLGDFWVCSKIVDWYRRETTNNPVCSFCGEKHRPTSYEIKGCIIFEVQIPDDADFEIVHEKLRKIRFQATGLFEEAGYNPYAGVRTWCSADTEGQAFRALDRDLSGRRRFRFF